MDRLNKKLLVFLAAIVIAMALVTVADIVLSGPIMRPISSGSPPAGDIVADLWETFEDDTINATTLAANDNYATSGWTVGGSPTSSTSANKATISTVNSTADTGTRGLVLNHDTSGEVFVDLNTYPTSQTVGFWLQVTTLTDGTYCVICSLGEGGGNNIVSVRARRDGSAYYLYLRADTTDGSDITISAASWYWVTVKYVSGGTCELRAYTDATTQATGSPQTITGLSLATYYHSLGGLSSSGTGDRYFDNFVIDKDADNYPLGP